VTHDEVMASYFEYFLWHQT